MYRRQRRRQWGKPPKGWYHEVPSMGRLQLFGGETVGSNVDGRRVESTCGFAKVHVSGVCSKQSKASKQAPQEADSLVAVR